MNLPIDESGNIVGPFCTAALGWQNFYVLTGTAAATLAGLMFIAVTFGSRLVTRETSNTARAFIDPTFSHFVQVLATACVMVIPTMTVGLLGWLMVIGAAIRLAGLAWVYKHMMEAHRKKGDVEASDWIMSIVLPLIAYLLLVTTGVGFIKGLAIAFNGLALATLLILGVGVRSAWELLVWMVVAVGEATEPPSSDDKGE